MQVHLQAGGTFQNKIKSKTKIFFGDTFNDLETSQNLGYGRFQFQHRELLTWKPKEEVSIFWSQILYELESQKKNLLSEEIKKKTKDKIFSYISHF